MVGFVIGGACAWAGGASLGTLFGPFALGAGVVPQRAARGRGGMVFAVSVAVGVVASWAFFTNIWASVVASAGAVFLTWCGLLASAGARRLKRPRPRGRNALRAAMVTLLAWAWLLWPIWLGPTLASRAVSPPTWLTAVHSLFAVNATATSLGVWTQQPLAYQLTPLGQDVAYALPASVWPCALAQAVAAGLVLLVLRGRRRR